MTKLKTYRIRVEDGLIDPLFIEEKEFICFSNREAERIFVAYIKENYCYDGKNYYLIDENNNILVQM